MQVVKLQNAKVLSQSSGNIVQRLFIQVVTTIQTDISNFRVVANQVKDPTRTYLNFRLIEFDFAEKFIHVFLMYYITY